jgi:Lrp/AsnC family transcriptional regulator, regulator for asnA, asnC and gidA
MKAMDKLDYLILSELLKDAALPFVTIAQKVGTSPYTVRRRFEKMKNEGVLHGCVVSLDISKLGYQGKLFMFMNAAPKGDKSSIISHLNKIPNVIVVTEMVAPFDIFAVALISDLKSIQTIVEETKKIPNVQNIKIAAINDIYFPIAPNFGMILSQKSHSIATT